MSDTDNICQRFIICSRFSHVVDVDQTNSFRLLIASRSCFDHAGISQLNAALCLKV